MIAFIDDHRDVYGVEPICRVLPIAPSTYYERVAQRQDPTRLSAANQARFNWHPRRPKDEAQTGIEVNAVHHRTARTNRFI